jgi:hypothetical protein
VLLERGGTGQKCFKRGPFGIFNFAVFIAGIQIFIKKITEIDLVKGILLALRGRALRNGQGLNRAILL